MRLRDLLGLNVSLAHLAISSSLLKNHRMAISPSVIAVMSSINARHGGCRVPSTAKGPLHSLADSDINKFMAVMNNVTDTEQPAMIPLSRSCHSVVSLSLIHISEPTRPY